MKERVCSNCRMPSSAGRWWQTRNGKRWMCDVCTKRRIAGRKKARLQTKGATE